MGFLETLPIWFLAGLIFSLRIFDVSLSTMRTISVVTGRIRFSVFLGFVEILVWVTAISQVILGQRASGAGSGVRRRFRHRKRLRHRPGAQARTGTVRP